MRKAALTVIAIASLFMTGSVKAASDGYTISPETERTSEKLPYLFENEQGIYAFDSTYSKLMYLDTNDMTWYPLCNKPECDHSVDLSMMQSNCNAFIKYTTSSGLVQWKDRIYYLSYNSAVDQVSVTMKSIKTDGTEHRDEIVLTADSGAQILGTFHNGRAYVKKDYLGEKPYTLQVYDLDNLQKEPEIIWEDSENGIFPRFVNDSIIYCIADSKTQRQDIYQMNLDGTDRQLILTNIPWGLCEFDKNEMYEFLPDVGLVSVEYKTEEKTVLWDDIENYECSFTYTYDGEFFYLTGIEKDEPTMLKQGKEDTFLILDREGNLLEEMTIPNVRQNLEQMEADMEQKEKNGEEVSWAERKEHSQAAIEIPFFGATSEYIFATDGCFPNYYIRRSEIGTGQCKWKPMSAVR